MDVSVLGDPAEPTDVSKHEVAEAGGTRSQAGDRFGRREPRHADHGARVPRRLRVKLYREGRFDGVIVLGGTMGTDLALDVCAALPLGVPKYVVSTVSFSPLLPAERCRRISR